MNLKKRAQYITIFLVSLLLVTGSLFIPTTLQEKAQSITVEFGLPFKYIIQQQFTGGIGIPEGPSLPFTIHILSPWENPTEIVWGRYWLNIAIIFGILWLMFIFAARFREHLQK